MKFKGIAELILGLWMLVSAFVGLSLIGASINYITVGIVVGSVSFFLTRSEPRQSWIAVILGFWLILAACIPFLLSGVGLYFNDIIVGAIIMMVGLMIFNYEKKHNNKMKAVGHINYSNYGSE